jgi:hypothetical protein
MGVRYVARSPSLLFTVNHLPSSHSRSTEAQFCTNKYINIKALYCFAIDRYCCFCFLGWRAPFGCPYPPRSSTHSVHYFTVRTHQSIGFWLQICNFKLNWYRTVRCPHWHGRARAQNSRFGRSAPASSCLRFTRKCFRRVALPIPTRKSNIQKNSAIDCDK